VTRSLMWGLLAIVVQPLLVVVSLAFLPLGRPDLGRFVLTHGLWLLSSLVLLGHHAYTRRSAERMDGPRTTRSDPGAGFEASLPDTHEALRELALGCTRCGLCETRTQVVFHDGQVDARVVVIGEAPGANEDRTGLPFVGAAGRLLDLMLASVDLSRERDVYICNVIKCRPPGNRNPLPAEIEACAPYLRNQLEILSPQVLLAVGTFASQWLTSTSSTLGKLRGDVHSYEGLPVVATYHPAALLRRAGWTRAAWEDLQLLRQILDTGDARSAGPPSP